MVIVYSSATDSKDQDLCTKRPVGAGAEGEIYSRDGAGYLNQLTRARKYFVGVVDVGKDGFLKRVR